MRLQEFVADPAFLIGVQLKSSISGFQVYFQEYELDYRTVEVNRANDEHDLVGIV